MSNISFHKAAKITKPVSFRGFFKASLLLTCSLLAPTLIALDYNVIENTFGLGSEEESIFAAGGRPDLYPDGLEYVWTYRPMAGSDTPSAVYGPVGGEFDIEVACDSDAQTVLLTSYEVGDLRPTESARTMRVGDVTATFPLTVERDDFGDDVMWQSTISISVNHRITTSLATSPGQITFITGPLRDHSTISSAKAVMRAVGECILVSKQIHSRD